MRYNKHINIEFLMSITNLIQATSPHYSFIGKTIRRHPYCAAAIAAIAGTATAVALYSALNQKTVASVAPVTLPLRPVERAPDSLETQFADISTQVDLATLPNFPAYLAPNETWPINILPHLAMTQPGLIVSVGTERSFFDLALSGPLCQGLVIRDIHPHVKAYVDFNVLLLRIAKDRQDYVQLSTPPVGDADSEEYREKIRTIQRAIENSPHIPPTIQSYYMNHLEAFAKIYFQTNEKDGVYASGQDPVWRKRASFDGVKYNEDDALFQNVQRHARAGNIIATVGDVGDLTFLDHKNITIVDTSNVKQYTIARIRTNSNPTIISTTTFEDKTEYQSATYNQLTHEQVRELDTLLEMVQNSFRGHYRFYHDFGREVYDLIKAANPALEQEKAKLAYYSITLLNALNEHKEKYCLQINNKWIDFSPDGTSKEWFLRKEGRNHISTCSEAEYAAVTPFLPLLRERLSDCPHSLENLEDAIKRRRTMRDSPNSA